MRSRTSNFRSRFRICGNRTKYDYDAVNHLTELTHFTDSNNNRDYNAGEPVKGRYVYSLAGNGQRTKAEETDDQGRATVFNWTYDAINRLTGETYNGPGSDADYITKFTYDLNSNRVKEEKDLGTTTELISTFLLSQVINSDVTTTDHFDGNDRLLNETEDNASDNTKDRYTVFTYGDGTGTAQTGKSVYHGLSVTDQISANLLESHSFSYDAQGRMTAAAVNIGGTSTTISYKYDDSNIRVEQVIAMGGTTTTREYVIDSSNPTGYAQVLEEFVNDTLARTFTLGADVVTQQDFVGTSQRIATFLYDGHGSTRALVDANGATLQRYVYEAYGELITNNTASVISDLNAAVTSMLYSGEQMDAATRLQYLRNRYLDLGTGRFSRIDTYEAAAGDWRNLNLSLYAGANPVGLVDPSGHFGMVELGINMFSVMKEYGSRAWSAYQVYDRANSIKDASVLVAKFLLTGTVDPLQAAVLLAEFLPFGRLLHKMEVAGEKLFGASKTLNAVYQQYKHLSGATKHKLSEMIGELGAGLVAKANRYLPTNFPRKYHGIESVFEDELGNLIVLEAKGGAADLAESQMSRQWLRERIDRLAGGDALEQAWAQRMNSAIESGKLKGGVVWTKIDHDLGVVSDPRVIIKDWLQIGRISF